MDETDFFKSKLVQKHNMIPESGYPWLSQFYINVSIYLIFNKIDQLFCIINLTWGTVNG